MDVWDIKKLKKRNGRLVVPDQHVALGGTSGKCMTLISTYQMLGFNSPGKEITPAVTDKELDPNNPKHQILHETLAGMVGPGLFFYSEWFHIDPTYCKKCKCPILNFLRLAETYSFEILPWGVQSKPLPPTEIPIDEILK